MIIKPKCGMFKGMFKGMGLCAADKVVSAGGPVDYTQDAGCQGAWYMNVDSNSETDRSGNGYTLIQDGTVTRSATVPSGYAGYSRNFVPASAYLYILDANCPLLSFDSGDKVSITMWIRPDAIPNTYWYGLAGKSATNNAEYEVWIVGVNTNQFKIYCYLSSNGTATTELISSTTRTADGSTWFHVAFVGNNTDMRVYVNGSLDCTPVTHNTGLFTGSGDFCIGNMQRVGYIFDGLIDEVAIFSRELSASEVSDIYTNGISGNKGGSD